MTVADNVLPSHSDRCPQAEESSSRHAKDIKAAKQEAEAANQSYLASQAELKKVHSRSYALCPGASDTEAHVIVDCSPHVPASHVA